MYKVRRFALNDACNLQWLFLAVFWYRRQNCREHVEKLKLLFAGRAPADREVAPLK